MIYGRQYGGNWLQHAHAVCKRYQDPGLSALLVVQLVLIFVVEPLASEGVAALLTATGIVIVGLILLLVVGAQKLGAIIIVVVAHRLRRSNLVTLYQSMSSREALQCSRHCLDSFFRQLS